MTFVDGELMNGAVVVAGQNVLLVLRGTDSPLQERNNGCWAQDRYRLWWLHKARGWAGRGQGQTAPGAPAKL